MARSEAAVRKYLSRVCSEEMLEAPDEILRLRRKFHSGKTNGVSSKPQKSRRERLRQQLAQLTWDFWSTSPEAVQKRLRKLENRQLEQFAGLWERRQQLLRVSQLASQWDEIATFPDMDQSFLEWVRNVLIAPPGSAQVQINNFLFDQEIPRKQKLSYKYSAQKLLNFVPYEWKYENELLAQLAYADVSSSAFRSVKPEKRSQPVYQNPVEESSSGMKRILFVVAFVILVRVLRMLFSGN